MAVSGAVDGRLAGLAPIDGRRYVALSFPSPIRPGVTEGPVLAVLFSETPGVCAWSPDASPVPVPPEAVILREYALDACDSAWAAWCRAEFQFARDFPPAPGAPRPGAAWVGPDGAFYPCRWMEHDRLAYRLAAALYADPRGPWCLEQRGWLRIGRDGTAIRSSSREPPSDGQLNALLTLLQVSEGDFREGIREQLQLARLLAERSRRG